MNAAISTAGFWLALIAAFMSACEFWDFKASRNRPAVLVIVTDDMGYTDLGTLGGRDISTPNLDIGEMHDIIEIHSDIAAELEATFERQSRISNFIRRQQ